MKNQERDSLHRFLFENIPVRGEVVHLDASWQAALAQIEYPEEIRDLLGQAMAASILMASSLKFDGTLTMQLQGNGILQLLVVQATSESNIRGLARWEGEVSEKSLQQLTGEAARLAITVEQSGVEERYQGIVPLEGETLAACLESYFSRSEQLPTRMFLHASESSAAGMLLQAMPGHEAAVNDWQHVTTLGETITREELLGLEAEAVLHRLYHQDDVRLFESEPVAFRCSCSRDRISGMLRSLGADEVHAILDEQDEVAVSCEFCGKEYTYDRVDAEALFAGDPAAPGTRTTH